MKKHTKKYNKKRNKKYSRKMFKIYFGGDGKPLQLLLEAAKRGDAQEIYKLYRKLKRSYITDRDNPTTIEEKALFDKINNRDENGFNALRYAYINGRKKALYTLLSIGAIDVPDNNGRTILTNAIKLRQCRLITDLVRKNVSFVTDEDYNLALQYFPATGNEGLYPDPLNNIRSMLARKVCMQSETFSFASQVEPKPHTELEEVVPFQPPEVVNYAIRDQQDYETNEHGQMVPIGLSGASRERGERYVYDNPRDIPKAEQLRSNAWQIWLTADPESNSIFEGKSYRCSIYDFFKSNFERFKRIFENDEEEQEPLLEETDSFDEIFGTCGQIQSASPTTVTNTSPQLRLSNEPLHRRLSNEPLHRRLSNEPPELRTVVDLDKKDNPEPVQHAIPFGGKTKKLKRKMRRNKSNKINKK
jgi:hypothetical protein